MSKADGAFQALTKEWYFTVAQTNTVLEAVGSTQRMAVLFTKIFNSHGSTVDVSARLGLAPTALPTLTANSAAGNQGMVFSYGGIAPGSGEVSGNGGQPIALSPNPGDDLLFTCTAPTSGDIRLIVQFRMLEDQ